MQADGGESGNKCGRKRKGIASKGVPDEQEVDALRAPTKAARTSEALIDPMLETWRGPVAKMW